MGCDPGVSAPLRPDVSLQALDPDLVYAEWFEQHTGIAPDTAGFGVYGLEASGAALYVGLGATVPAWGDGALLARFDGQELRAIAALDEQGFGDMTTAGDELLVAGVDPCCGDDWSLGNLYVYGEADGLRKRRTLPYVVHGFGVWHDPETDATYVSTGSHLGDEATFTGAIWRSDDRGLTWSLLADRDDGVGDVRTYDVLGAGGALLAVRSDSFAQRGCQLVRRTGAGPWTPVTEQYQIVCWPRLARFGHATVAQDASGAALHTVRDGASAVAYPLPFRFPAWSLQWGVAAAGVFYALTDEGAIVRSRDLRAWETLVTTGLDLIAIDYWEERGWIVVGGAGESTGVWRIAIGP